MITPMSNNYQPHFKANLKSPALKISNKDFFIKLPKYGADEKWAEEMVRTANYAVDHIRGGFDGEAVLRAITGGVVAANMIPMDIDKRLRTGYMRIERSGWTGSEEAREIITPYDNVRYGIYEKRLDNVSEEPLKRLDDKLAFSYPDSKYIVHGEANLINNSLEYVFKLYKDKYSKFLKKDVTKEDLPEIIDVIAEIRYVLAHATPWLRGSDAISNVLMRAMFKAVGVKAYPPADGVSYDLEAYCRNLDDYKANFNSFFEKPLEVIE